PTQVKKEIPQEAVTRQPSPGGFEPNISFITGEEGYASPSGEIFVPRMSVQEGAGLYTPTVPTAGVSGAVYARRKTDEEILRDEFRQGYTSRAAQGFDRLILGGLGAFGYNPIVDENQQSNTNKQSNQTKKPIEEQPRYNENNISQPGVNLQSSSPLDKIREKNILYKNISENKPKYLGFSKLLEEEYVTRRQSQKELIEIAVTEKGLSTKELTAGTFVLGSEIVSPQGLAFLGAGAVAYSVIPNVVGAVGGVRAARVTKTVLDVGGLALGGLFSQQIFQESRAQGADVATSLAIATPSIALTAAAGVSFFKPKRVVDVKVGSRTRYQEISAFSREDIAQLDVIIGRKADAPLIKTLTESRADVFLVSERITPRSTTRVITGFKEIPTRTSSITLNERTIGAIEQRTFSPIIQAIEKGGDLKIQTLKASQVPKTTIRGAFELVQLDDATIRGLAKAQSITKQPGRLSKRIVQEQILASESFLIDDGTVFTEVKGRRTLPREVRRDPERFVDLENIYKVTLPDVKKTKSSSYGVFTTKELAEIREGDTSLKLLRRRGFVRFSESQRRTKIDEIKDILRERKQRPQATSSEKRLQQIIEGKEISLKQVEAQLKEATVLKSLKTPELKQRPRTRVILRGAQEQDLLRITGIKSLLKSPTKASQVQRLRQASILEQIPKQDSMMRVRQDGALRQRAVQTTIPRQQQIPRMTSGLPTIPLIPGTGVPIIPGSPLALIPGFGIKLPGQGVSRKNPYEYYNPDFTARTLGIRATKKERKAYLRKGRTYSGLELRPIV
ncbi:MAG TPA: hypothetical protein VKE88_02570, partial [Candidatus Nanoarchaeia archaeon]|nr:hypothetical protein [Candidatus Nanoarchaeia archaeon]